MWLRSSRSATSPDGTNTKAAKLMDDDNSAKANAVVSYKGVSVRHDDYLVLANVNLEVYPCDFVFLTGAVGTGKSSLLRTIYADLPIAKGKAEVLGFDMRALRRKQIPALRRQLGVVFQDGKLLENLTVEKNLSFVLRATGVKQKGEIADKVAGALRRVGLVGKENKFPSELSGGERQRASIARAIINSPKLVLADEPTGNLDKAAAMGITDLLEQISEQGAAVIMSTHNLDLIESFSGKVLVCENKTLAERDA